MARRTIHKRYRIAPLNATETRVTVEGWRAALETAFELKQAHHCNVEIIDAESNVRLRTVVA